MAKLKAPLMSLGASGQLAKTLVFFPWKGINAVREYVIPSYRRTGLQATQRDWLKDAVTMIHTAMARAANPLNEADQTAYSALATAKGKIMTWFNQVVKLWVDVERAGKTPVVYSDGQCVDTLHTSIDMNIYLNEGEPDSILNCKFYFGSTKTNLIHSEPGEINPGVNIALSNADLKAYISAGKKYYWQLRPDATDPCVGADSGIYSFVAT